jgi:hypothetical protein
MQKKRAKKRKKELRKKSRRNRLYTFQKNLEKTSGHHDSPGFKITLFALAEIFFGILTLFQTINLFANWTRCVKENGIIGTIFLFITNIAFFGGLTYLFSYLIKKDKKKDTDTLQFDNCIYHLAKEKSLSSRANAVLEREYKTLVEDLNKLDVSSEFGTHPREVLASPEDIDVAFSNTTFRTFSTEENERIKDFSDAFASLCVANCELDKEQNYTDDVTGGNVKYNEKRFDNLTNDSVISQIVSDEKIKEVSDKILHVYSEIGLMVMIDGSLCTNQYVVLKLKPMHGTRINDVISIQSSIESEIGMKSLMNVMYKKGYIGILLPIYHFIEKEKNPTTGE